MIDNSIMKEITNGRIRNDPDFALLPAIEYLNVNTGTILNLLQEGFHNQIPIVIPAWFTYICRDRVPAPGDHDHAAQYRYGLPAKTGKR